MKKSTKTNAARKPTGRFLPEDIVELKKLALEEIRRGASIYDRYFSVEQQAQIGRLQNAGDFEGRTESEAIDKTIATLAQAALYVLGLDPLAEDALYRLDEVVYDRDCGFSLDLFNAINDDWPIAQTWTKGQRAAELGETPRSASAKEEEAAA